MTRELIASVPSMTRALETCYRMAGVRDKEAAYMVGVDYCHFQRMFRITGGRHFPPDLILPLMERCRNTFPLEWLAHQSGMAVYPLEFHEILTGIKESLTAEGKPVRFELGRF